MGTEQSFGNSLGKSLNDLLREKLSDEANTFFRSAVTKQTLEDRVVTGDIDADRKAAMADRRAKIESSLKTCAAELAASLNTAKLRENYEKRMAKLVQEQ